MALAAYLAYYLPQPKVDFLKPGLWFASFLVDSAALNVGLVLRGGTLALGRADNSSFFEGIAPGTGAIPYAAWAEPLAWWAIFLIALYVAMVSIAVILRRQWMERERLAYPLTQVGLAMVHGEGEGLVNRFFTTRAVWYGCALPMFFGMFKALHHYDPAIPSIHALQWSIP